MPVSPVRKALHWCSAKMCQCVELLWTRIKVVRKHCVCTLVLRSRTGRLLHAPHLCHGNKTGHRLQPRAVQGPETAVRGSSSSQDPFILGFIVSSHSGPGRLPVGVFRGLRVLCSTGCSLSRRPHCAAGHMVSMPRDTWWPASGRQEGCFLCWGGRVVIHRHFSREEAFHPPPSPPTVPFHTLALHTFLGYKRPSRPLGAVTRKEKQLSYPFLPLKGGSLGRGGT